MSSKKDMVVAASCLLQTRLKKFLPEMNSGKTKSYISESNIFERLFRDAPEIQVILEPESHIIIDTNDAFLTFFDSDYETFKEVDFQSLLLEKETFYHVSSGKKTFEKTFLMKISDERTVKMKSTGIFIEIGSKEVLLLALSAVDSSIPWTNIKDILLTIHELSNHDVSYKDVVVTFEKEISKLIDIKNFYAAIYDEEKKEYFIPYYKDAHDTYDTYEDLSGTPTDYVRKTGSSLVLDFEEYETLHNQGLITWKGHPPQHWIGIPLNTKNKTIGVLGLHKYDKDELFQPEELNALELIANALAIVLMKKQVESELKKSEDRFSNFFEHSEDAIYCIEFKTPLQLPVTAEELQDYITEYGYYSEINKRIQSYFELESGDSVKSIFKKPYNLKNVDEYIRLSKALIESSFEIRDLTTRELTRDGSYKYFFNQSTGIIENGKLLRIWGAKRNITERMRTRQELFAKNLHLNEFINNLPQGIVFFDADDKTISVNPEFSRMFGFTIDDILDNNEYEIVPEEYLEESKLMKAKAANGLNVRFTSTRQTRDGRKIDVSISGTPILSNEEYKGTYWVYRDITLEKRSSLVQEVLFTISQATSRTDDLDELLNTIHVELGRLIETKNFYVALFDEKLESYRFQYFIDEKEILEDDALFSDPKSLTDYVRRNGSVLLNKSEQFTELEKQNEIKLIGPHSKAWLGVQLITRGKIIGVAVVQSYDNPNEYSQKDVHLLEYVSGHIAQVIDHKIAENQLRQSERLYRTFFDQSPVGIVLYNTNFEITTINDRMTEILARNEIDIKGKVLSEFLNNDQIETLEETLKGNTKRFESIIIHSKSSGLADLLLSGSASPLYEATDEIVGGILLIEDLTQKEMAERELKVKEIYLQKLFETAPEAIALLDNNGLITRINNEFTDLFGYSPEEVMGEKLTDLIIGDDEEELPPESGLESSSESFFELECNRKHKDGRRIEVSLLGSSIEIDNEKKAMYLIYRDIADRKRNEELNNALFNIAKAAVTSIDLDDFLETVYKQVGLLLPVNNFHVTLYDEKNRIYSFPICYDEKVQFMSEIQLPLSQSLFEKVRLSGLSQHYDKKQITYMNKKGEIEDPFNQYIEWIGSPLKLGFRVIGVVSVGSYSNRATFTDSDVEVLEFISGHIAGMIEHKRAEIALMESEERYRTMFDQSPVGVLLFDKNLIVTNLNERHAEILNESRNEVIGTDLHINRDKKLIELMEKVLEGKTHSYSGNYLAKTRGKKLWLDVSLTPHYGPSGIVMGGIAVVMDQTERKNAEKMAETNRVYLEQLFDGAPEAFVLLDPRLRVIRTNQEFTRMFGYRSEDAFGKLLLELISSEDEKEKQHDFLKQVGKGNHSDNIETVCSTMEGKSLNVSLGGTAIEIDNQIIALYAMIRDISASKQASEALAAEKERLSVTLSSIGEGVVTTDVNEIIQMANLSALELVEKENDEVVGRPFDEVFTIYDRIQNIEAKSLASTAIVSNKLEIWPKDYQLILDKQKQKIIQGSSAPIHSPDGGVIGAAIVLHDVSEQVQLEFEISKVERLESIGVLAGGIAHDFNNILSAVLGNLSIARMIEDKNSDMQKERLEEAEKAAHRAKELTQQLLTFSKGGNPVLKAVSIKDIIEEATSFALRGSNVRSSMKFDKKLLPAEVDEVQITRVINNLVLNANQAMPEGGHIYIKASNATVGDEMALPLEPGKYVQISIKDEGIGISKENIKKIFDPFFTTKQSGTGLGLATSFSIIQKHAGHMTVESIEGKGTEFTLFLPATDQTSVLEKDRNKLNYSGEGKVLVMDDEESVLDVASTMLEALGFEVECCYDGAKTIETYQQARMIESPFIALIMDLTIPGGMGGEETIRHLKKLDPEVKAIVSSGYSNDPVMSDFKKYGFSGILAKPYTIEELANVLEEVIGKHAV